MCFGSSPAKFYFEIENPSLLFDAILYCTIVHVVVLTKPDTSCRRCRKLPEIRNVLHVVCALGCHEHELAKTIQRRAHVIIYKKFLDFM
jgi:hypothetical protein